MDNTSDAQNAMLSVPVNTDVFFLGSRKGKVDRIIGWGVEDVGARLKVDFVVVSGSRVLVGVEA